MKYLSLDIESTGLDENCLIIELAFVPFNTSDKSLAKNLGKHFYVKCPDFESLKPSLNPWVAEHNEALIRKAHQEGIGLNQVKIEIEKYLQNEEVKKYFNNEKITLFGKSMNAIDLPFLTRDFGWDFMRKYFNHKVMDLSSVAFALIDLGLFPEGMDSSSALMKHFQMGEVAHTAMEDAINTAKIYFKIIDQVQKVKDQWPSLNA